MTRIALMRLAVGGALLAALIGARVGDHPWP